MIPAGGCERQDAPVRLVIVFGFGAAIADLRKASQTILRVTHPPLRRRAGRTAERPANGPRRRAIRGHKHNLRLQARAMFRLGRTRQALKLGAFLYRQ